MPMSPQKATMCADGIDIALVGDDGNLRALAAVLLEPSLPLVEVM